MNKNTYSIIVLCLLLVGMQYINAWTGPATSPAPTNPPNNNVAAPVNLGTNPQVKAGGLGVANFTADSILSSGVVESNTQINSPLYCDENGANCVTGASLGGGWGTWQNMTGSRLGRVWYQNTTGAGLAVHYHSNYSAPRAYVSPTGSNTNWVEVAAQDGDSGEWGPGFFIVPPGHYYYIDTGASMKYISELKMGI